MKGAFSNSDSAAAPDRTRILARIARANAGRNVPPHPGRLETPAPSDPAAAFAARFAASGGEVVVLDEAALDSAAGERSPGEWLGDFIAGLRLETPGVAVGAGVPAGLRPPGPFAPPETAGAGVCLAWAAVAETGSLALESTGGRATQLLPPVLVVWVQRVFCRLADALAELAPSLPAAVGLHSGPSKSADIGGRTVVGVHGPGRCIAVLHGPGGLGRPPVATPPFPPAASSPDGAHRPAPFAALPDAAQPRGHRALPGARRPSPSAAPPGGGA